MKILLLDIETAPNLAYVWGLWKENVSIDKIVNSGYVLCWAAKWHGESGVLFDSIEQSKPKRMMRRLHGLLEKADVVVTYNGISFDLPTVNKEFVQLGFQPPEPYRQVDMLAVVRKQFRFPSNKLDYVCQALGLGAKVKHRGFELWVQCMAKDKAAWREMEKYNRGDVVILEALYDRLLPWIEGHPNRGAFDAEALCPKCGSTKHHRRGVSITTTLRYARYQCLDCGGWFRSAHAVSHKGAGHRANYVSVRS